MAYASSAVAAMEAHQAVAGVVQSGLWLLANLSMAGGNRVSGSDVIEALVVVVRREGGGGVKASERYVGSKKMRGSLWS
jgi:hypothetical protein